MKCENCGKIIAWHEEEIVNEKIFNGKMDVTISFCSKPCQWAYWEKQE